MPRAAAHPLAAPLAIPLAIPLVMALASTLALAPVSAVASPYRVLAAPAAPAGEPVPAARQAAPQDSPPAATAATGETAATSPTQPLSDDPALEYRLGEQAYALGNYEQAVRHFERSYQLSNFADLLYNLGMAYAQWYGLSNDITHLRKARRLFQNYSKRLTDDPAMDQSQRQETEAHIAKIDEQIAAEEARQAAAKPVVVVKPELDPAPPPTPDQPRKPVYKRGWFWGVLGGLVVAGAVTAAIVLTRKPGFEPELGTIGPNAGGLRF